MRDLGIIEHFAAGAVGEPGRRIFLLELDPGGGPEWYLVEKEQVAALAAAVVEALGDAMPPGAPGPDLGEPGEPVFRVGRIGVGARDGLVAVELHPAEEDADEAIMFQIEDAAAAAMARRALLVVAAGRPPCPMCGLPMDPGGHTCPSSNGDLRTRS